jgi:hypothetical protein
MIMMLEVDHYQSAAMMGVVVGSNVIVIASPGSAIVADDLLSALLAAFCAC